MKTNRKKNKNIKVNQKKKKTLNSDSEKEGKGKKRKFEKKTDKVAKLYTRCVRDLWKTIHD